MVSLKCEIFFFDKVEMSSMFLNTVILFLNKIQKSMTTVKITQLFKKLIFTSKHLKSLVCNIQVICGPMWL